MTMLEPHYCPRPAWEAFRAELPGVHTTGGLVRAAAAVALLEHEDVVPAKVEGRLKVLASAVGERTTSRTPDALLAHLHAVFFEELGFRGNMEDYRNTGNAYLSRVLSTRRGFDVTLSLIYRYVAERIGLVVEGVGLIWCFFVRVRTGESKLLVDPFFGGKTRSLEEAFRIDERVGGAPTVRKDEHLRRLSNSKWLARILLKVKSLFKEEEREREVKAVEELERLHHTLGR